MLRSVWDVPLDRHSNTLHSMDRATVQNYDKIVINMLDITRRQLSFSANELSRVYYSKSIYSRSLDLVTGTLSSRIVQRYDGSETARWDRTAVRVRETKHFSDILTHSGTFPEYAIANVKSLYDWLVNLQESIGPTYDVVVTCTLRLRGNSSARNSLHHHGLAVDFKIVGMSLQECVNVLKVAVKKYWGDRGFIGRYQSADGRWFVHYDPIGPFRVSKNIVSY